MACYLTKYELALLHYIYLDELLNAPFLWGQMERQVHLYHLVEPSGWPIISSFSLFNFLFVFFLCLNYHEQFFIFSSLSFLVFFFFLISFFFVFFVAFGWFFDVIVEGTFLGFHTSVVSDGLRIGMILFILSEILFFVSFFWAFFHSSLAPTIQIGSVWPPFGFSNFNPYTIPLVNTLILLYSGCSVTYAHHLVVCGAYEDTSMALIVTIIAAFFFSLFQFFEYKYSPFNIEDGIYSSIFFLLTGFHGFHVIIGTIFLIICLFRHILYHFTVEVHVGLESGIWYWHFVDVVWLAVYFFLYVYSH